MSMGQNPLILGEQQGFIFCSTSENIWDPLFSCIPYFHPFQMPILQYHYMGGSINGGTLRQMVYSGTCNLNDFKWMIWGYPHFKKPPYILLCFFPSSYPAPQSSLPSPAVPGIQPTRGPRHPAPRQRAPADPSGAATPWGVSPGDKVIKYGHGWDCLEVDSWEIHWRKWSIFHCHVWSRLLTTFKRLKSHVWHRSHYFDWLHPHLFFEIATIFWINPHTQYISLKMVGKSTTNAEKTRWIQDFWAPPLLLRSSWPKQPPWIGSGTPSVAV